MPTRYPYLVKRDGENCAALHYQSFVDKYIVYDNEYIIYDSINEMLSDYEKLDKDKRHWFEVIPANVKQRFKFDIDIDDMSIDINDFLTTFTDAIILAFKSRYDIDLPQEELFITSSHGKQKYSFHILILSYGVIVSEEAKNLCLDVKNIIPDKYQKYVDLSVYKSIQQFRMLYSSKINSDRVKRIITPAYKDFDFTTQMVLSLVRCDDITILGSTVQKVINHTPINDELVVKVDDLLKSLGYDKYFRYNNVAGNFINYMRYQTSRCPVHDKLHESENIFITVSNNSVYYHCRRKYKDEQTSLYLGKIETDEPTEASIESEIALRINNLNANTEFVRRCKPIMYESIPNKMIYKEPTLRPYNLTKTSIISAQMKMGKTKNLKKFVDEYFAQSSLEIPVIRFLSARMTFSNSLKKNFKDFDLYNEIEEHTITANNHPRVIVQVESIHRLCSTDHIDLLILDEVESILEQFNSPLHKNISETFAIFEKIMRDSEYVICMDANISDRTYNCMKSIRHDVGEFHQNTYSKAETDTYYITTTLSVWYSNLEKFILEKKRIIIPTNSLAEAETCNGLIESVCKRNNIELPRIMLYTSKTSATTKSIHFEDVNTHWKNYDIIIYTPTMSAGVSFEEDHFDVLFGYFNNNSCTVETCRQMLGRARTVNKFYICLKSQYKACYPTDINIIKDLIYSNRLSLFDNSTPPLYIKYDTKGNKTYEENNYAKLWFENTRMENLSKNYFIHRFIDQIHDSGAKLINMTNIDINRHMTENRSIIKKEISQTHASTIASAKTITDDEAKLLRDKLQNQIEISDPDRNSLDKYNLMKLYKKTEIDSNFVVKYNDDKVKTVYKNLSDLYSEKTIEQSLESIRLRELNYYINAENDSKYENINLQQNSHYKYGKHKLALHLLNICGLNINKTNCIYYTRLVDRFVCNGKYLHENKKLLLSLGSNNYEIITHYQKYLTSLDHNLFITYVLKQIINPVLKSMYGITIKRRDNGVYIISNTAVGNLIGTYKDCNYDELEELIEIYISTLKIVMEE